MQYKYDLSCGKPAGNVSLALPQVNLQQMLGSIGGSGNSIGMKSRVSHFGEDSRSTVMKGGYDQNAPGKTAYSVQIFSIPSDIYILKHPVSAVVEREGEDITASIPDLEIYGEGDIDSRALSDLKRELVDLADFIFSTPEEELGEKPLSWKKSLQMLLEIK